VAKFSEAARRRFEAGIIPVLMPYAPSVAVTGNQGGKNRSVATLKSHAPRKPTLVSVSKQASKAKLEVTRYEVKPDGTVVIITGKPEKSVFENEWDEELFHGAH
jgi:hypothetical protein